CGHRVINWRGALPRGVRCKARVRAPEDRCVCDCCCRGESQPETFQRRAPWYISMMSLAESLPVLTENEVPRPRRVRTNNDAVCSPEGIRTPDLFLEREAPWTTRRPGRAYMKSIGPGSSPSGDDRGHDHLHQQVVCVVQDPKSPRLLIE